MSDMYTLHIYIYIYILGSCKKFRELLGNSGNLNKFQVSGSLDFLTRSYDHKQMPCKIMYCEVMIF